jgi:hypothetical protein
MKFLQKSEKINNTIPYYRGKYFAFITGLKGINHMDQLYCCIFGMILFVLFLHF